MTEDNLKNESPNDAKPVLCDVDVCGILFHRRDFKDESGCLKPKGHNDFHVCKTDKGTLMGWEDDYSCKCGCWDDYEKGDSEVCMVYWEVDNIA